jgi:putative ABC transport system substrate-binding protein
MLYKIFPLGELITMKKIITILIALIFSMSFMMTTACEKKTDYTVGILQLVRHSALDAANNGFQKELNKLMKEAGKTVKYDNKNASGDKTTTKTMADVLVSKNVDLILAIATPAAQAVAAATDTIPVLFTAVTDAVAADLVDSNENPKYNVSGTSDLNPIDMQVELITRLVPGVKKIAVMYNTAEQNSRIQVQLVKNKCAELNIQVVDKGISDQNNIEATFLSLPSDVEAIYIPTDNMLANAKDNVHIKNKAGKKLPIVCGEIGMNDGCGVATYGIDYYKLGQQTAQMAFDILVNGADISKMPVELQKEYLFSVNQAIADEINFTIPQAVMDEASK